MQLNIYGRFINLMDMSMEVGNMIILNKTINKNMKIIKISFVLFFAFICNVYSQRQDKTERKSVDLKEIKYKKEIDIKFNIFKNNVKIYTSSMISTPLTKSGLLIKTLKGEIINAPPIPDEKIFSLIAKSLDLNSSIEDSSDVV